MATRLDQSPGFCGVLNGEGYFARVVLMPYICSARIAAQTNLSSIIEAAFLQNKTDYSPHRAENIVVLSYIKSIACFWRYFAHPSKPTGIKRFIP